MRYIALLLALAAWFAFTSAEAAPSSVSFTGRLSTASGPVDGSINVRFTIYDQQNGGSQRWTDDFELIAEHGLVFATLGRVDNPLDEAVFTGAAMFLEIIIQDEILSPRLSINSTPYAIRSSGADSADLLGTLAPDDVVTTINAGSGLMGGGSGNTIALGIDSTKVQSRITGTCPAGQAVQAIGATGAVTCEVDNDTTYSATTGGGLTISPANQISADATVQRRTAVTNNMTCPTGQYMRSIAQTGQTTCVPALQCSRVSGSGYSLGSQYVPCPSGSMVMGGGCYIFGAYLVSSNPDINGGEGWFCEVRSTDTVKAYAICCNISL